MNKCCVKAIGIWMLLTLFWAIILSIVPPYYHYLKFKHEVNQRHLLLEEKIKNEEPK